MLQLLLSFTLFLSALNGPPVTWNFSSALEDEGSVQLRLEAVAEEGWHIYATELENDLGPIPTTIRFEPSEDHELLGTLVEPLPKEEYDPNFEMQVRYHSGRPVFTQRIKPVTSEAFVVEGEIEYMVCNDVTCLPPTTIPFRIEVPAQAPKP
jgi:thiol:disulfide interchange protein DsbD